MAKVIEVTSCQTCLYKTQYNTCGNPEAYEHRDENKALPTDGSIADFCTLQDKDDYLESEFDIDMEPGDIPDYVPESGDRVYTKKDFIEIAKGNKQYAKLLRSRCTWQHPETLVDEDLREGEITEVDGTYLLTGGNDEEFEDNKPEQENIPAIERMYNSDHWVEAQRNEIGTPDEYDEHGNEIKQPTKGERWKTMPPPFQFNDESNIEGWGIFYTGLNDDTFNLYELQTHDEVGEFDDDWHAKKCVVERAIQDPKSIHAEALLWLARYCEDEIDDIRLYIGDELWAKLKEVMRGTEFDKF